MAAENPGWQLGIVEIGSWGGESALAMVDALGSHEEVIEAGHRITCVDTWEGSDNDVSGVWAGQFGPDRVFELFKKNCAELYETVIYPVRGHSPEILKIFGDDRFDLIHIDAGHSEHEVLADIQGALPKLRKESFSVLSGHDFGGSFPGVRRAVRSLFSDDQIHNEGEHWWVEFPAEGSEPVSAEQPVTEFHANLAKFQKQLEIKTDEKAAEAIYAKYDGEREACRKAKGLGEVVTDEQLADAAAQAAMAAGDLSDSEKQLRKEAA